MQRIKSDFEPLHQVEKFNCESVLISYLESVSAKEEKDMQYLQSALMYMKIRHEAVEMMSDIKEMISKLLEPNNAESKNDKNKQDSNSAVSNSGKNLYNIMITKMSGKLLYERKKYEELERKYNEMATNESHIAAVIEQAAAVIDSLTGK